MLLLGVRPFEFYKRSISLKIYPSSSDKNCGGEHTMVGLEPGSLFAGRYEIIRRLGAGGMGAVYLACDPADRDFKVALKLLYPGTIQSNQARERFRNEITASYRIKHPNVVQAYEYFDAEDVQAYAMEYVDGGDLLDRLREGPMAPYEALDVLTQLASALEAIHKAGIVHRDLKPENIMISRKGVVKIADFGVARLKGANTLTQAGSMVGTPKYLAPEYVETGECDGRGDIFAVGVMGYELISGASPFGKDFKPSNVLDRLKMHIPPLQEVAPQCPAGLAKIVEKAMSLRLLERYRSANDLRVDLERFSRGEISLAEQELTDNTPRDADITPRSSVQSWEDPKPQPVATKLSGSFFSAREQNEDTPATGRPFPLLAAACGVAMLISIAGFASLSFFKASSPLRDMPKGIYKGLIGFGSTERQVTPIGVWNFPEHTLILVGEEGCSANVLDRSGAYTCGERRYRFTINSTKGDLISGSVTINETDQRPWTVSRFVESPNAEPPLIPKQQAVPTKNERAMTPPATHLLEPAKLPDRSPNDLASIAARLKTGELSPEEAAKIVLKTQMKESDRSAR